MNSLWIQKKVDWDDFFEITCPYCKNGGCVGSDALPKLKYCPYCGARMDLTDASDAELVDMLQDVLKGKDEIIDYLRTQLDLTTEDKQSLARALLRKEEVNTELAAAVNTRDGQIASLKCQLGEKEEELFTKHNEYAQLRHEYDLLNSLFEDMKRVVVKVRPHEWAALAKKHNKED